MKIDKQNGNVCFNDENHCYWNVNDNEKYISVTTLIHKFTQPFDKDFWSSYKALEKLIPKDNWTIEKKSLLNSKKFDKSILDLYDISEVKFNKTQQGILDEWDNENRKSCERGTKIHEEIEHSFYNNPHDISLQKFGIGGKFECKRDYSELDLEYGVYPEYLIYRESDDGILRIAGQVDLIIKSGNEITIVDHKGLPLNTPIATREGFKTMQDLQVGDKVFDKDGNLCNITIKSEVHHNPCYKITFDNSESIVADAEHRWLIHIKKQSTKNPYKELVMTTAELAAYIDSVKDDWNTYTIPKILNAKPLNTEHANLPIDPYVLGCWLGDGSKQCGLITNVSNNIWEEIKNRGYEIGQDVSAEDKAEAHTVLGIYPILKSLNLLNNKHIPDIYLRASYEQRLDLLRGLMDTDGYYHPKRKRFVMNTDQEWQMRDLVKLLGSLGIKSSVFEQITKFNGKEYFGWNINFSTLNLNPFLSRNQEIDFPKVDKCSFRNIMSVEPCEMVPTQCIAVDSPSHTYLAGYSCIVTHNTNKEIKTKSTYNKATRSTYNMKYPLNNLPDINFYHYTMQLSTYAWMLQKINPNFVIKDLILNHYDHNGNNTLYHCEYLKSEVEKMLYFYKKQVILERQKEKRKRIEY